MRKKDNNGLGQTTYLRPDKIEPVITLDLKDKVRFAIELLQAWEPTEGYYFADSGGKDSCVTRDLLIKSGVKFDAHYNVSPIDPKPIYDFLKQYHPDTKWDYHAKNFWKLVEQNDIPLRQKRWCCRMIKEAGGNDRVLVVGNRKYESEKRSDQCYVDRPDDNKQVHANHKSNKQHKTFIRPILFFTDDDVWTYIRDNNVQYCELYDIGATRKGYGEGVFKRLGCVMCPNNSDRITQALYNPKLVYLWKRSCARIIEDRKSRNWINKRGKPYPDKYRFNTGEEYFNWWINDHAKPKTSKNQGKLV